MYKYAKVFANVEVLRDLTVEQERALKNNVLADGLWESAQSVKLWMDMGTLMLMPCSDLDGNDSMILIGIEKDGYTHS